MREFAQGFYTSRAWKQCRDGYAKSVGGLCEICLTKGLYRAGEIVHHKIHLTPDNIHDPDIALSWDNLQLVCRDCHAQIHSEKNTRYIIHDDGTVTAK